MDVILGLWGLEGPQGEVGWCGETDEVGQESSEAVDRSEAYVVRSVWLSHTYERGCGTVVYSHVEEDQLREEEEKKRWEDSRCELWL